MTAPERKKQKIMKTRPEQKTAPAPCEPEPLFNKIRKIFGSKKEKKR